TQQVNSSDLSLWTNATPLERSYREVLERSETHFFLSLQGNLAASMGLYLNHEVLRPRVMHHNRRRRLLRLQQESAGQPHSHILLGMKQRKQLSLIFQIRTRRIAKRISRSTIFLMK